MEPQHGNENSLPTTMEGIIETLTSRGCKDLTSSIHLQTPNINPFTGGGFCDVYKGVLNDGTKVAIKCLRVYEGSLREGDNEGMKVLQNAAKEIYHWSKLRHPNVLPLMGLAVFKGLMSMISGWMDNGNLATYVKQNPSVDRLKLCLDVCDGLSYIHSQGMVHGDLKGVNVMISSDGTAMIADFGSAQLRELTLKFTNTESSVFSVRWAAPELLEKNSSRVLTKEADIYAYGMTVLEVLTGEVPYHGSNFTEVLLLVVEKKLPSRPDIGISDNLWDLVNSCWAQTPTDRPQATLIKALLQAL